LALQNELKAFRQEKSGFLFPKAFDVISDLNSAKFCQMFKDPLMRERCPNFEDGLLEVGLNNALFSDFYFISNLHMNFERYKDNQTYVESLANEPHLLATAEKLN